MSRYTLIAIQNYSVSGSSLFHSYFDGHPNVLYLPGNIGSQFYATWRQIVRTENATLSEVVGNILPVFADLWTQGYATKVWNHDALGPNRNETCLVDVKLFKQVFAKFLRQEMATAGLTYANTIDRARLPEYRRAVLFSVYQAYAEMIGDDVSLKTHLLYASHNNTQEDIAELQSDFAKRFYLFTVRDPVNMMASIPNHSRQRRLVKVPELDLFETAIVHVYLDRLLHASKDVGGRLYQIHRHGMKPGTDYKAFRLEDLHADQQGTMRWIAEWVGLPWHESLTKSTAGKKQWWNRRGFTQISGSVPGFTKSHRKEMPKFDAWRLNVLARPIRRQFGYERGSNNPFQLWVVDSVLALASLLPFSIELEPVDQISFLARHVVPKKPELKERVKELHQLRSAQFDVYDQAIHPEDARALLSKWDDSAVPKEGSRIRGWIQDYLQNRRNLYESFVFVRRNAGDLVPLAK